VTRKRSRKVMRNQDALGAPEHVARDCPDKEKGPKCFKCNAFGHIAAKCNASGKSTVKKDGEVNTVDLVEQIATDDEIIVELSGYYVSPSTRN